MSETIVSLKSIADGAGGEVFDAELAAVLKNIRDQNTSFKAKREIVLKVIFAPTEERERVDIEIKCTAKLAPARHVETEFYLGKKGGVLVAAETNPRQPGLFDKEKPASDKVVPIDRDQEGVK